MKKRAIIVVAAATAAITAVFYAAPFQSPPRPLSGLFPGGAVLYLEAKDFGAEARAWNGSEERQRWTRSARYEAFSRSTLFLRLQGEWQAFSAAAGFVPDSTLVESVAGRESALALYDIGKLEFLYITRMPGSRLMETAFWQSRAKYESRKAGRFDFFVRSDAGRTIAFASADEYLIVGTREEAVAGALRLLSSEPLGSLESEGWFKEAVAAGGAPGDLRLVMNLEALVKSPQFRSYWVQRNASETRNYWTAVSDIRRTRDEIREDRSLLRKVAAPAITANAEAILRLAPDDAAFCRSWARPRPDDVVALTEQKLLAPKVEAQRTFDYAPTVEPGGPAGSEADLETHIDEPPLAAQSTLSLSDFRRLVGGMELTAVLEAQSTRTIADGVFVATPTALAIEASKAWDAAAVRAALTAASASLWTTSGAGAGWVERRRAAHTWQALDGLARLQVAAEGNLLFIANDEDLLVRMLDRINRQPAASNAVSVALFRHAAAREDYRRMMLLLDRAQRAGYGDPVGARAGFFGDDLWSLSEVFARVSESAIRVRDEGSAVRETVNYRLR